MKKLIFITAALLLSLTALQAQLRYAQGVVLDEFRMPMVAVSVTTHSVHSVLNGTITNFDGYFYIEIPSNAIDLKFSYIGYKTVVVPTLTIGGTAQNPTNLVIYME